MLHGRDDELPGVEEGIAHVLQLSDVGGADLLAVLEELGNDVRLAMDFLLGWSTEDKDYISSFFVVLRSRQRLVSLNRQPNWR